MSLKELLILWWFRGEAARIIYMTRVESVYYIHCFFPVSYLWAVSLHGKKLTSFIVKICIRIIWIKISFYSIKTYALLNYQTESNILVYTYSQKINKHFKHTVNLLKYDKILRSHSMHILSVFCAIYGPKCLPLGSVGPQVCP